VEQGALRVETYKRGGEGAIVRDGSPNVTFGSSNLTPYTWGWGVSHRRRGHLQDGSKTVGLWAQELWDRAQKRWDLTPERGEQPLVADDGLDDGQPHARGLSTRDQGGHGTRLATDGHLDIVLQL